MKAVFSIEIVPRAAVIFGPPVALSVFILAGTYRMPWMGAFPWISLGVGSSALVSAVYLRRMSTKYFTAHYIATLVFMVLSALLTVGYFWNRREYLGLYIWMPVGGALFCSSICTALLLIIKRSRHRPEVSSALDIMDTRFIETSLSRVKDRLRDLECAVSRETDAIDNSMHQLAEDVLKKNRQLQSAKREYDTLSREVDDLKQLSSLTRHQADLLIRNIRRNRPVEFVAVFALGVLAGLLVEWLKAALHLFARQ